MSSEALINKIIAAAETEAEHITDDILKRAGENEKLILDRAAAECENIKKQSDEKCAQIRRISKLTSDLEARKSVLHVRRTLLDEAFDTAYRKMTHLPDDERAGYMTGLIVKYAPSNDICVSVSKKDLPLTEAVAPAVKAALDEKFGEGSRISFSGDERIKGGAYIASKLCDVDATLDAIFEELREKYEAEADKLLFSV